MFDVGLYLNIIYVIGIISGLAKTDVSVNVCGCDPSL